MKRVLLVLACAALATAGGLGWLFVKSLDVPAQGVARIDLTVARGATLKPVLRQLAEAGVLRQPEALYLYARLTGRASIQSGFYALSADMTPRQLLAVLHEGRVSLDTVTVAEGLNRWQVRDLLVAKGWLSSQEFDALCDDPALLSAQAIPGPTCEGYLFPETYTMARGVAARRIFAAMFAAYRGTLAQVRGASEVGGELRLSEREFVTLASLIEKETAEPDERPRIACVFHNRLRAVPHWRLETDPSVVYAAQLADPDFDGNLRRQHLRQLDSPYNTYRVYGLPPGPIASPGRAAFEAAAHPAACRDFFFVSKNNGRHVFCETLDCHNKAVQKWQVDYFRARR